MEFLVYRSEALVPTDSVEARRILETAIRRNGQDGLTGFLHREGDVFVQYLEGPRQPLQSLWKRLLVDPRHRNPTLLGRGMIGPRLFADWRMGYSSADVASFLEFLDEAAGKNLLAEASAAEAIWFLRGVRQRVDLGLAS